MMMNHLGEDAPDMCLSFTSHPFCNDPWVLSYDFVGAGSKPAPTDGAWDCSHRHTRDATNEEVSKRYVVDHVPRSRLDVI